MTKENLQFIKDKVKKYSKLLNLDIQGWKITVECDCIEAIRDDLLSVGVETNPNTKVAVITLSEEKGTMMQYESLEEVVIHELLHVKFWFVDWEEENAFKAVLLENAINELALILSGEHR